MISQNTMVTGQTCTVKYSEVCSLTVIDTLRILNTPFPPAVTRTCSDAPVFLATLFDWLSSAAECLALRTITPSSSSISGTVFMCLNVRSSKKFRT